MAKSYIHELGDRLSNGFTADNLPKHIKEIAPIMYNDGSNNFNSIQSALNGKAASNHTHGNIANGGTLTDTAAAAAGNDYVVIRDADNAKIQTSTIKGTDVADAVSKKHSHSTLTLSTTAQAYDGSHTLALPSTDPYTSARTPTSHTHGNIQNGGTLQTNDITIANGDKLVVTDSSDSSKVARASIAFDGSTTTQALTKAGTWATFNNYSHPAGSAPSKTGVPTANATPGFGGTFKVNQITTDATSHVSAVTERTITIPNATATTSAAGLMSAADKTKLDGIATGAEVNQNAFSNVKVGSTTVAADTKTDTLEIVAGGATIITADSTNDKITISSTDKSVTAAANHYTPSTDSSAEKDASGGTATQLPTSSTGTLVQVVTGVKMDAKGHVTGVVSKGLWSPNTTYSNASLGQGYGTCDTEEATAAKMVTLSNYSLTTGGIVAVKFTYGLCASATMNINSRGAKKIFIDGAEVTDTTAKRVLAGDIAYFIYDGTQYHFLGTDNSKAEAGTASPLMDGKASVGNSLKYAREDHVHPSDTSREDKANKTTVVLGTSNSKYPTDKAVAEFVNSSIATNTANYISNNGEPFTSVEQLEAYSGTVTNNDYAFVTGTDSEGNTYYDRYKATVSGSTVTWALEYRLNNSSFTAAQWSSINSGITSVLVSKIHDHSNKDVLDGITSTDVANWNNKMDRQSAGNISEPVYIENGIAKIATNVATTGNLEGKLNVDGSNATTEGVTAMMKKVESGSEDLNDDSYYFGDSNADHTHIVRRPILNIWNYIKKKVQTNILGSVGSADKPIYLENGYPKVCADGVPYSEVSSGGNVGYGVFVGGGLNLAYNTRCYCTFLVSVASSPYQIAHTYIGTFTFRGKTLKSELRCLTGIPAYPLRIVVVSNVAGKDSNGNPTYNVGLYVIPADKTYIYSKYTLTRIASTSDFIWDVKKLSVEAYDACDDVAKNVFMTQTAMIKDVANKSNTDTNPVHIYYDDIICNNGTTEYTINISRLVIGKTYRFHIMKDSQAATYLYNYGETSSGTVHIYCGDRSISVTQNVRFALNGSGSGTSDHTITVARMTETQIYVIWGY